MFYKTNSETDRMALQCEKYFWVFQQHIFTWTIKMKIFVSLPKFGVSPTKKGKSEHMWFENANITEDFILWILIMNAIFS